MSRHDDDHDLHRFLAEVRETYREPPDEDVAARHLAAMRRASRDDADAGVPVVAAAWRSLRWTGFAVAALLGLVLGLAAGGALPDPAQRVVADTVSRVGLDFPRPHRATGKPAPTTSTTSTTPPPPPSTVPPVAPATAPPPVTVPEEVDEDHSGPGGGGDDEPDEPEEPEEDERDEEPDEPEEDEGDEEHEGEGDDD